MPVLKALILLFPMIVMAQDCIPFIDNTNYCRMETGLWYLTNSGAPSQLYLDGVYQSEEPGGTATIDFLPWPAKHAITVAIVDNDHGIAVCDAQTLHYTGDIATGIRSALVDGCAIITLSWTTSLEGSATADLSNACWEASQSNVIMVCSVPNANLSIDSPSTPAYPVSWNLPLSVPVTSSTRLDAVYTPAAVGANVIAAPGRVIVTTCADGPCYGSGTSYAAPMVAGVAAWLLGQFQQPPAAIVEALRAGSVPIDNRIVGRVSMAGALNALRPTLTVTNGPEVHGIGVCRLEWSPDCFTWSETEITDGNRFVRARIQ